ARSSCRCWRARARSRATAASWARPIRRRRPPARSAPTSPPASKRTLCTARMRPRPPRARSPTSSASRSCTRASEERTHPMPAAAITDPAAAERTNLLGLARPDLEAFIEQLGGKPFRARQLMSWIYKRGVDSFAGMTDLAKQLRARLDTLAEVRAPEILSVRRSADGTCKWLLRA